jgi:hypothetical protein
MRTIASATYSRPSSQIAKTNNKQPKTMATLLIWPEDRCARLCLSLHSGSAAPMHARVV